MWMCFVCYLLTRERIYQIMLIKIVAYFKDTLLNKYCKVYFLGWGTVYWKIEINYDFWFYLKFSRRVW